MAFTKPCESLNGTLIPNCHKFTYDPNSNVNVPTYNITIGQEMHFDWIMSQIHQGNILIIVSPCVGNVHLMVQPPILPIMSFQNSRNDSENVWVSERSNADNIVIIQSRYLRLFITVYAKQNSTFQLGVFFLNCIFYNYI